MGESTSTRATTFILGPSFAPLVRAQDLLEATMDFIRIWIETAVRKEATAYGAILENERYPLVHEANLAWVESLPKGGPGAILADLDRAFAGTAVRHRNVMFRDAQEAFEAQEAFVGQGFEARAELVMAKLGLPACIVNPEVRIREVGAGATGEDYRRVRARIHASFGYAPEESRQVHALECERSAAVGEGAYLSFIGFQPVGSFTLWPRGRYAMIGNVATLPEFRNRGVGRTMIFDALRKSIEARCEYAVLATDLLDSPKLMYETLGFQPVGEFRSFLRR